MKTTAHYLKTYILLLVFSMILPAAHAQENGDENGNGSYFTISGVVKNKNNNNKLEYVNVSVPGTNIGTVTNEDGEFSLKISKAQHVSNIEFSLLGFFNSRFPVSGENLLNSTFYLTPKSKDLPEVVVTKWDPLKLMQEAIGKIPDNYNKSPNMLTAFYRETIKKKRSYINIAEAVIRIYKTGYGEDINHDRVQILKGRKLLSTKKSDTLAVKLQGGPNMSVIADIVKNPDIILSKETLGYFKYTMEDMTIINDRPHFVVKFEPQVELPYPLYYGKFFIDSQTKAFTRAEFNLDMKDRNKATQMILRKKPAGLRFNPEELSFVVSYKQVNGLTYLSYIRNEVKFKCDWKRRLFATNYTVISEMVVTDMQSGSIASIPGKEAFRESHSLSDKVMNFYDDDFWGSYNIIEPSESLESAVSKLKKEYK